MSRDPPSWAKLEQLRIRAGGAQSTSGGDGGLSARPRSFGSAVEAENIRMDLANHGNLHEGKRWLRQLPGEAARTARVLFHIGEGLQVQGIT